MGGGYGLICGAVVNGKHCYARGQARYDGRCRYHAPGITMHRCGHALTENLRCHAVVSAPGVRCARHKPELLARAVQQRQSDEEARTARKRSTLEKRLQRKLKARRALDVEVQKLRDELAALPADGSQPSEVRA